MTRKQAKTIKLGDLIKIIDTTYENDNHIFKVKRIDGLYVDAINIKNPIHRFGFYIDLHYEDIYFVTPEDKVKLL